LNLTVQEGLKSIFDIEENFEDQLTSSLTKLCLCINTICWSPKIINQLQGIYQHLKIKYYDLPNDYPTCWSSTYMMINMTIKQKIILQTLFVITDAKYIKNALDYQEWNILEANLKTLKIFAEGIKALSIYMESTLHQVENIYNLIKRYLEMNGSNISKSMIAKIEDHLTQTL
jgi:hypothetical protein